MSIELNSKCRTCLRKSSVYFQLFDDVEKNYKILEMLDCIVPQINIKSTSQFSTLVCKICVEKLLIGYKFQQLCLESNKRLRDLFGIAVIEMGQKFEIMEGGALTNKIDEGICTGNEIDKSPRDLSGFAVIDTHQKFEMIADPLTMDTAVELKNEIEEGICTESILSEEKMADNDWLSERCSEIVTNPSICQDQSLSDDELKLEGFTKEVIGMPHDLKILPTFQCRYCPKRFEKKASLSAHYNAHKDKKLLKNKSKNLISDLQVVLETTKNSQTIAEEELNNESQLYDGNTDDNLNQLAIKFAAAKETKDLGSIDAGSGNVQQSKRSSNKYVFECQVCGKIFDRSCNLQRHNSVHSTSRPYECEICKYRFCDAKTLRAHLFRHKGEGEQNISQLLPEGYKCEVCHRHFMSMPQLAKHFKNQHPEVDKHKCVYCSRKFMFHNSLLKHINHRHKSDTNLICQICKKVFGNAYRLNKHMLVHNSYLCPHCGKTFRGASNLRQHLERHTGLQKYQCPDCPKRFNCKSDVIKHASAHSNAKPHVCDICGARFSRKYSMQKHKTLHTAERSYKCDQCNMTFKLISLLKRHMRTHTGEKPHKCKYCERAYLASGDLTKHLRTHVGENTYMCDQCPESFKYQAELRQHQSEHYKMDQQLTQKAQEIFEETHEKNTNY